MKMVLLSLLLSSSPILHNLLSPNRPFRKLQKPPAQIMAISLQRSNSIESDQPYEGGIVENKVFKLGRNSRKIVAPMDTAPRLIKVTFENAVPSRSAALKRSASAVRMATTMSP